MSKETKIEWCDSTVNPTSGCDGCELWNGKSVRSCYAGNLHETRLSASHPDKYARSFLEVRMIPGRMTAAANWNDLSGADRPDKPWLSGKPRHIFIGDMGDIMSKAVTDDYLRREVFDVMTSTNGSRHIWIVLTKLPARLANLSEAWGGLPSNCIAMTTVTNQRTLNLRVPELLRVNARRHGLSCEPLLGPINIPDEYLFNDPRGFLRSINWIIAGGESGSNPRPMHPSWPESIGQSCFAHCIPFFFKQWGRYRPLTTEDWDKAELAGSEPEWIWVNALGESYDEEHPRKPSDEQMILDPKQTKGHRILNRIIHSGFPA